MPWRLRNEKSSISAVTAFGAFVALDDLYVEGLLHISELSDRFVKDPREVVKAGDVVRVRVRSVDMARKRIGLTMKAGTIAPAAAQRAASNLDGTPGSARDGGQGREETAVAAALRRAQKQR